MRASELSDRQRQIVALVVRGMENQDIGRRLGIGTGTVKTHVHRVLKATGLANRTALVRWFLESER